MLLLFLLSRTPTFQHRSSEGVLLLLSHAAAATNPLSFNTPPPQSVTCCFTQPLSSLRVLLAVSPPNSDCRSARSLLLQVCLTSSGAAVTRSPVDSGAALDVRLLVLVACYSSSFPENVCFLKARNIPSLSAWSRRAAMPDVFALFTSPAQTASPPP